MVENIKKVSNPLTIIAIFAALAEINGTVAIGLVKSDLQPIFIWFIILFPTLLIVFFFLTLNFNPKVIYAPSDFKDEENFVKTISGSIYLNRIQYKVSPEGDNINQVQEQVEKALEIVDQSNSLPNVEKSLTKKANSFFDIFLKQVQPLFDDGVLEELSFGIESPEFFLLTYSIPKDKLNSERRVRRDSIIIKLTLELENSISFEAIGKGIKEIETETFAFKVSEFLKKQVDNATNPNKKPKF